MDSTLRRRLQELLNKYGLAGTDFVGQLHRELYNVDFISEMDKLDLTEIMAEVDYRLVEGGGERSVGCHDSKTRHHVEK